MLSSTTWVSGGELSCVHKSKNGKYLQQGQPPRFACFLPYATAHAKRSTVLRTGLLGLMHRIHMDTLAKDVPALLPVLLSYDAELQTLGYPSTSLLHVFERFLRHPKVSNGTNSQSWYSLYRSFARRKQFAAA
jgi:hypothetical protein